MLTPESAPDSAERNAIPPPMKAQYATLVELKAIEERISRLIKDIENIPKEIEKLDKSLLDHKAVFQKTKAIVDEAEKTLRKSEADLREKEEQLKKAQGKMMEVKTNDEYRAAIKENEMQGKVKGALEDIVLKLLTELEGHKKTFAGEEEKYREWEKKFSAEKTQLETERTKLVTLHETEKSARSEKMKDLPADTAELYRRVSNSVKGIPLAWAENGRCVGCNIAVRPQMYNEILGFKAFHRCSSCGRLLVVRPTEEKPESASGT